MEEIIDAIVLIPYISGLICNQQEITMKQKYVVLIPYISGLICNRFKVGTILRGGCLNPLYIGSHL